MPITQTQPIEVFYWTTPNGRKITVMAEELGIPYTVSFVDIGKDEQFAPAFLAISPNNRIPAITDPEGPGGRPVSVFESGAILQYLGRKFGRFYPVEDEVKRIEVESWLMWQMGGFGPMLGQAHHFMMKKPGDEVPYGTERYGREAHRLYRVLNTRLVGRDFVVGGDFSIADIAIFPWVARHERHRVELSQYPDVARWYAALDARPGVRRGMAVAPSAP